MLSVSLNKTFPSFLVTSFGFLFQDQKLADALLELGDYKSKHSVFEQTISQLKDQVQQLKDQNALHKAQKGNSNLIIKRYNYIDYLVTCLNANLISNAEIIHHVLF